MSALRPSSAVHDLAKELGVAPTTLVAILSRSGLDVSALVNSELAPENADPEQPTAKPSHAAPAAALGPAPKPVPAPVLRIPPRALRAMNPGRRPRRRVPAQPTPPPRPLRRSGRAPRRALAVALAAAACALVSVVLQAGDDRLPEWRPHSPAPDTLGSPDSAGQAAAGIQTQPSATSSPLVDCDPPRPMPEHAVSLLGVDFEDLCGVILGPPGVRLDADPLNGTLVVRGLSSDERATVLLRTADGQVARAELDGSRSEVRPRPEASASVRGFVLDASGRSLGAGLSVRARHEGLDGREQSASPVGEGRPLLEAAASTDANGRFRLDGLPAGTWTLRVRDLSYTVRVRPGQTATAHVSLR